MDLLAEDKVKELLGFWITWWQELAGAGVPFGWHTRCDFGRHGLHIVWVQPQDDVCVQRAAALHLVTHDVVHDPAQLPALLTQYVVFHELCHAAVKQHGVLDWCIAPSEAAIEALQQCL
jgi:hypothetical protein